MVLKFDDIIYQRKFEIETNDGNFDVVVSISDKESLELAEIAMGIVKGTATPEDMDKILFKDKYEEVKEALIGFNYNKFHQIVMSDYQDFTQGSISESIKNLKDQ